MQCVWVAQCHWDTRFQCLLSFCTTMASPLHSLFPDGCLINCLSMRLDPFSPWREEEEEEEDFFFGHSQVSLCFSL